MMSDPERKKKMDAEIKRLREQVPAMSFGDIAIEINTRFDTSLTRSAVGARYNRANGRSYRGGTVHVHTVSKRDKLPYPRYSPQAPREPERIAVADKIAEHYREVSNSELFHLRNGVSYRTLAELRDDQCHWPLEGPNGKTYYCGQPVSGKNTYCAFHNRKAKQ